MHQRQAAEFPACCFPSALRWHNHLSPAVKKAPFSEYEDAVILKVRTSGCWHLKRTFSAADRQFKPLPLPLLHAACRHMISMGTSGQVCFLPSQGNYLVDAATTIPKGCSRPSQMALSHWVHDVDACQALCMIVTIPYNHAFQVCLLSHQHVQTRSHCQAAAWPHRQCCEEPMELNAQAQGRHAGPSQQVRGVARNSTWGLVLTI